jgi:LysM repeat protein
MAFDWVRVNRPVSLSTVADICGTSAGKIRELNPALTRGVVPHTGYTLRIPKGTKQTFMAAAAVLPPPTVYASSKARSGGRCSGKQADGSYCLRSGETIGSVAKRYGVTTQALLKANGIRDPRRVAAGQPLVIPGQEASTRSYTAAPRGDVRAASFTHRVRSGETIGLISARYGLTPAALAHANQIRNVNRLRVGQVLEIPSRSLRASSAAVETMANKPVAVAKPVLKEPSAPARVATQEAERNSYTVPSVTDPPRPAQAQRTHTVRNGETPFAIAKHHGVSLDELLRANGVRDARRIQVGRTLVIPGRTAAPAESPRSPATRTHRIVNGETVADIAGRYGISTRELMRANGISDVRRLQVGRTLVIPAPVKRTAPAARAQASATIHTVRAGDTLYSVAQRYRISVSALTSANGIRDARSIRVGQKLKIPQQVASK